MTEGVGSGPLRSGQQVSRAGPAVAGGQDQVDARSTQGVRGGDRWGGRRPRHLVATATGGQRVHGQVGHVVHHATSLLGHEEVPALNWVTPRKSLGMPPSPPSGPRARPGHCGRPDRQWEVEGNRVVPAIAVAQREVSPQGGKVSLRRSASSMSCCSVPPQSTRVAASSSSE